MEGNASTSDIVIFNKANPGEFQEVVIGNYVEVIEIKKSLGRNVIGQVIIGADLLEMAYEPNIIEQVVVCEVGDPLLELICKNRGINIWKPSDQQYY